MVNSELHAVSLTLQEMKTSHTAKEIKKMLSSMLEDWGIPLHKVLKFSKLFLPEVNH